MIHPNLFKYQVEGAGWLANRQNAILADQMRVGKTPTAVAGCDLVQAKNVLVVCPGIARIGWQREFEFWQTAKRSTCVIQSGKDEPHADVVIISYELICTRKVLEKLFRRRWDVLIVDEAHLVKNKDALRTKVVYGAKWDASRGLASVADRVWLLTGTPIPNCLHEMWVHARALFPSVVEGLERYNDWVDHFCRTRQTDFGVKIVEAKNLGDFVERFRPHFLRRMLADVQPDLPPLRFGHAVVRPDQVPPQSEEIKEAEAVIQAAFAQTSALRDAENLNALAAIQSMHLSSLLKWTGIAKAPAVAEALKFDMDNGLDKVVVFAKHTEVFEILKKVLPESAVINGGVPQKARQPIIDTFQGRVAGKRIRALLVHIDIASTALDLTAAHDVAFAETGWVPKDILQAAMRCQGVKQTRPVMARIFSLKGSLDEGVSETIVRKYRTISKIEAQLAA